MHVFLCTCVLTGVCVYTCVEDTGCGCLPQSLSIFETLTELRAH